jgi:precorrin-3B synthase
MTDAVVTNPAAAVLVKGWCPGAVRPMAAHDGLVVRIRPPGGRLSMAQAQGIAALAEQFAHPQLELTNRANLQLRAVDPAHHASLLTALRALALIDDDAADEARRNVQVQPLWTDGDITPQVAHQLSVHLRQQGVHLPAKFGFAVDTGPWPCLRDAYADIRLERHADGVLVYADGADHGVVVTPDDAPHQALALARWFLGAGGAPTGRGRMSALLGTCPVPAEWLQTPVSACERPTPAPGAHDAGYLVALAFGLIEAHTLAQLGAIGALRLTPWRSLLVEGAPHLPALPDLITEPADALRRVAACTGSPGCEQAFAPARGLAVELATAVPSGHLLHVSGCAKGCAHPRPTTTVVATPLGFDFIRQGTAASLPDHRGLSPAALSQLLQQEFSHAAQL